jgi:hypothetical protein
MSPRIVNSNRTSLLKPIVATALFVLGLKVLVATVLEYRRYFPADFEATFLIGREASFTPTYAAAFYVHIITGPITILLGTFLMLTGGRKRWLAWHRWAARVLMFLIFAALVPSGLLMAPKAFAGPIASIGFVTLSLLTALTAGLTLGYARLKKFGLHQRWATRCFVLLISPLLLRVVGGLLIVLQADSELAYVLNAWFSWLVPLALLEIYWICTLTQRGAVLTDPRLG